MFGEFIGELAFELFADVLVSSASIKSRVDRRVGASESLEPEAFESRRCLSIIFLPADVFFSGSGERENARELGVGDGVGVDGGAVCCCH